MVVKKKYIPGNLFVVIISPFTNHFTAGVIIEFQAKTGSRCAVNLERGDTRYKSPCQSHISNIKSFLPVEAEISVMKV